MEPRDRVVDSLNHKEPDRVPRDLGSSLVTGIHRDAYKNYLDYKGEEKDIEIVDRIQQLAKVREKHLQKWSIDTRGVFSNPQSSWTLKIESTETHREFTDEWGIRWSKPLNGGLYYDITKSPLAGNIGTRDIKDYDWPDPKDRGRLQGIKEQIREINSDRRYFIFFTGLGPGIYELCQWLRGHKDFWLDLLRDPELAETLLDKITELKLKFWEMALEEVGDLVDTVYMADDLGTQEQLQISRKTYRDLIKPYQSKLFHFIKENAPTRIFIFYHSDGAIKTLIPDLIEAGIDILNPLQVSARDMNPQTLKEEFGNRISFWGGGGDPHGAFSGSSPEEVKEELKVRVKTLKPGGGWVCAPIHNVQRDVSPKNIEAFWEVMDEYGGYG